MPSYFISQMCQIVICYSTYQWTLGINLAQLGILIKMPTHTIPSIQIGGLCALVNTATALSTGIAWKRRQNSHRYFFHFHKMHFGLPEKNMWYFFRQPLMILNGFIVKCTLNLLVQFLQITLCIAQQIALFVQNRRVQHHFDELHDFHVFHHDCFGFGGILPII